MYGCLGFEIKPAASAIKIGPVQQVPDVHQRDGPVLATWCVFTTFFLLGTSNDSAEVWVKMQSLVNLCTASGKEAE